jgi:3',5'-cyclic AMP phosphodiesterase CpdA
VVHLSDLHFGKEDTRVMAGLCEDLSMLAADGGIDAVVVSGDLTQRARAGQFSLAVGFIERLVRLAGGGVPVVITPGNHDVPLWDVTRRVFAPLENYARAVDEIGLTEARVGDVALATACSARRLGWRLRGFWKDGLLDAGRVKRAAEVLTQSEARWRVMVTHHPVAVGGGLSAVEVVHGWKDVAGTVEQAGVNVILGGHLHEPYVAEITLPAGGKATYVAAGTAVSTRLRHAPNSYNLLEFGAELRVERRDWTGERFVQVG